MAEQISHRLLPQDRLHNLADKEASNLFRVGMGLASTFDQTGMRGGRISILASAVASASSAGFMRLVWKAPATARRIVRAPAASASRSTSLHAALTPDTTIFPGHSRFAICNCARKPVQRHNSSTCDYSRPSTLTMPLGVASEAACIASPRRLTIRSPSSKAHGPRKNQRRVLTQAQPGSGRTLFHSCGIAGIQALKGSEAGDKYRGLADYSVELSRSVGPFGQTFPRS